MTENKNIPQSIAKTARIRKRSTKRKWCVVPMCTNNSLKTPNKMFIPVPCNPLRRKLWLEAMKFKRTYSTCSYIYCCEDHFQIEEDMANYGRYKLMGGQGQIRMKETVVPHIFDFQTEGCEATRIRPRRVNPDRKAKQHDLSTVEDEMDCDWSDEDFLGMETNVDQGCLPLLPWDLVTGEEFPLSDVEEADTVVDEQQVGDAVDPLMEDEGGTFVYETHDADFENTKGEPSEGTQFVFETQDPSLNVVKVEPLEVTPFVYETQDLGLDVTKVELSEETRFVYETQDPSFNVVKVEPSDEDFDATKQSEETQFVYETQEPSLNVVKVEPSDETQFVYETQYPSLNDEEVERSDETQFAFETQEAYFKTTKQSEETRFVYETQYASLNVEEVELSDETQFEYETQYPSLNVEEVERSEETQFVYETQEPSLNVEELEPSDETQFAFETQEAYFNATKQSEETQFVYETQYHSLNVEEVEPSYETQFAFETQEEDFNATKQSEETQFVYETKEPSLNVEEVEPSDETQFVYKTQEPDFNATKQSEETRFVYETQDASCDIDAYESGNVGGRLDSLCQPDGVDELVPTVKGVYPIALWKFVPRTEQNLLEKPEVTSLDKDAKKVPQPITHSSNNNQGSTRRRRRKRKRKRNLSPREEVTVCPYNLRTYDQSTRLRPRYSDRDDNDQDLSDESSCDRDSSSSDGDYLVLEDARTAVELVRDWRMEELEEVKVLDVPVNIGRATYGPTNCKTCGKRIRRKQCLHFV